MPMKGKRPSEPQEPAITAYEVQRLRQCMKNQARLKELGVTSLANEFSKLVSIASDKNRLKHRNSEDSESEYDPEHEDIEEEDFFDANTVKKTRKRSVEMPPGGLKHRPAKRVLVEQATTRCTRSKKYLTMQNGDASSDMADPKYLTPSDMVVPTSSPHTSQSQGIIANNDDHTLPNVVDARLGQPEGNTHLSNQSADGINQPDEQNQMGSHEGDAIAQDDEETQIYSDFEGEGRYNRGVNMGKGLPGLSRARRGKLPIIIPDGKTRPLEPIVAAKFATECNIAVRNHMPVFRHWKDYKKQPALFKQFVGKVDISKV